MPEFRLTKKEEEQLQVQFEYWKKQLNFKVAPLIIAASLGAFVAPDYREPIAYIGIFILIAAFIAVKNHFPSIFQELGAKKAERTFREEIIYRGIASYYFSFKRNLVHFPLYFLSVCLLVIVAVDLPSLWNI